MPNSNSCLFVVMSILIGLILLMGFALIFNSQVLSVTDELGATPIMLEQTLTVNTQEIPDLNIITEYDDLTLPLTIHNDDGSITFLSNVADTSSYWLDDQHLILNIGTNIYFWDMLEQRFWQSIAGSNLLFNVTQSQYYVIANRPIGSIVTQFVPEIRDLETNELLYDFTEYPNASAKGSLGWINQGNVLVTFKFGNDSGVQIWDTHTGKLLDEITPSPSSTYLPPHFIFDDYVGIQYILHDDEEGYLEDGPNQLNYIIKVSPNENESEVVFSQRNHRMAFMVANDLLYTLDSIGELIVIDLLTDEEIYRTNVGHITGMQTLDTPELSLAILQFWNEETYSLWRLTGDRNNLTEHLIEVELDPSAPLDIYGLGDQFVNLLSLPYIGLRVETETNLELDLWHVDSINFEVETLGVFNFEHNPDFRLFNHSGLAYGYIIRYTHPENERFTATFYELATGENVFRLRNVDEIFFEPNGRYLAVELVNNPEDPLCIRRSADVTIYDLQDLSSPVRQDTYTGCNAFGGWSPNGEYFVIHDGAGGIWLYPTDTLE